MWFARSAAIALMAIALAACAEFQQKLDLATGAYSYATETAVPASAVIPLANTFDILKAGAVNYGRYCIQQKMQPAVCSADIRRIVVRAVRSGTAARDQLKGSLRNNEPAAASIFNTLVAAVNGLQVSPAANSQFTGR